MERLRYGTLHWSLAERRAFLMRRRRRSQWHTLLLGAVTLLTAGWLALFALGLLQQV
jgi:hypothetical protein